MERILCFQAVVRPRSYRRKLNSLGPEILENLGADRGRAVITYLQFALDKVLDYNSKQAKWHPGRGVIAHTFSRHDFFLKWTFAEMILSSDNSGLKWGLDQIVDAYRGLSRLLAPIYLGAEQKPNLTILNGTADYLTGINDRTVDLVCIDPPYYDNVMYADVSDYFYVWQRRTLRNLYPELFVRKLTEKELEAVANPAQFGGKEGARVHYEESMSKIFLECRRVLKHDGLLTIMFTHKTQEAWEALTRSIIESGWDITASFPVESESGYSMHQRDMAAAASSIFLACRKRSLESDLPASWTGIGGQGVQHRIRDAVAEGLREFEPLRLNPVDEMVASYGRALHILSRSWPVMDGDDQVSPIRAMNEASRVVAENQIRRITAGRLKVDDLDPETAMALTLYGIYGLYDLTYDEALNLSRSLNIRLEGKTGGYRIERGQGFIGINQDAGGRGRGARAEDTGYAAPLIRKGSKLRLARPEERDRRRLEQPLTDWDRLHGLLLAFRKGDLPVARQYLAANAADQTPRIIDLLEVWAREMEDDEPRKEAEALLYGLKQTH